MPFLDVSIWSAENSQTIHHLNRHCDLALVLWFSTFVFKPVTKQNWVYTPCIPSFSYVSWGWGISAKIAEVGVFIKVSTIIGWVTAFTVTFSCILVISRTTIPLVVMKVSLIFQPQQRHRAPLFNNIEDSLNFRLKGHNITFYISICKLQRGYPVLESIWMGITLNIMINNMRFESAPGFSVACISLIQKLNINFLKI